MGQLEYKKEREERQMEDRTLHELLTSLTEQMNLVFDETHATWQGEVQNLWDALHSRTHDVHLKNPDEQFWKLLFWVLIRISPLEPQDSQSRQEGALQG